MAKSYYEILDVEPTASEQEITRAYRRLSKMNHPDNLESLTYLDPEFKAFANERMKEINDACHVLKDPQKRAEHDRYLAQQRHAEED
jgi:DnaJ-class molecular chaperone